MIKNLSLKNFKAFEEEEFDFGSLNILSGLNNSGKSSVIQSLRLLHEQKPLADMGPLVEYVRRDSKGFDLRCSQLIKNTGKDVFFSFERTGNTGKPKCSGNINGVVSYISADRLGPRNSLPLSIGENITTAGSKGEHIVDFLSKVDSEYEWDDLKVPAELITKEGNGIRENIKEWLRVISPGVDFDFASDHNTDTGRTMFNNHRPVHTGFGLSYTLPIIASVLIHSAQLIGEKTESVLLLIENPEAHLHPSGQTKMGELFVLAASCGVQIMVETHSDHILNGVRIAVKDGKLSPENINCYFLQTDNDEKKDEKPVLVNRISIDRHGMMDYWPDGFFDETEKSLLHLV
jgi:predicted ATPase